ncbi:TPA: two-component system sensor histidine kinase QseC [Enterobacter bugandensis]|uniref:quorum sensing histidine kinase QseC n=1 Tax=Enterobacter bugandensis TaxID=881260 RepID=UPI001F353DA6|nr:quorum sensing histidine kinase QseC [Enterobacter bugandensis]HDX4393248.1 two-component system sensor histidine kinase QseC [Enterobacter bugandensis]
MKLSLKLRLTLLFLALSLTAWFAASLVAWQQTTHKLDKLFDTQQMLFAKRLLTMDLDEIRAPQRMREVPKKAKHGHLDDDALAFAIYASDGTMILNDGENGRDIPYHYRRDGFDDGRLQDDNDEWRFLWLTSPDGKYRVVVGQEWEYRQDMALDVVSSQLTPWLVALPVMLLLLIVLLSRELKPLKKLAQTLRSRSPDATDALTTQGVPAEVRPLLDSLNHLFTRTQEMMTRERRFTSDAAHELRSPLAALKVQTDVAQLSQDDPQAQEKALAQLHAGIDRASRLVDQLLTLSRLDSLESLDGVEQIPMADLLQSAVMDIYPSAQQAGIDIRLHINAPEVTRTGQQLLLSLLARNLLDNATRYSPRGSVVDVTLNTRSVTVRDNGPGISPDALARLGERFYRPPGQDATGSGLGLSIVKRIAALHGMRVSLGNAPEGGFEVKVNW